MNECQIFKIDLLDTFLDLDESVVEEVGMRVAEYPRDFVCCGDVIFCGCVCTNSVLGVSVYIYQIKDCAYLGFG